MENVDSPLSAVNYGRAFYVEIEAVKRASGGRWTWERFLPGPIDDSFANLICEFAGCWCYDNNATKVRFYTNQNHPSHS